MSDNTYDKIEVNHSGNIVINIKQGSIDNETELLPGYTEEHSIPSNNSCELCWNCCHKFKNQAISIPLTYVDSVFYIYGYFCSFNCGARYIFDNYNDKKKWNLYSLLNLYYNISLNTRGEKVSPAPNKLVLERFGGTMSIDDYRKDNSNYVLSIPPIIPVEHSTKQINESRNIKDNKEHFKLYRKKPLNSKNNIYNTMNLN